MTLAQHISREEIFETRFGTARVVDRADQLDPAVWRAAFARDAKDDRYYRLCEATLQQPNFHYRYLLLTDQAGAVRALQPFFFTDQDILAGLSAGLRAQAERIRRAFPPVHDPQDAHGRLHGGRGPPRTHGAGWPDAEAVAGLLEAFEIYGRAQKATIVTFKDFTKGHRLVMTPVAKQHGYARMPSFPATTIDLSGYTGFEDYLARRLGKATRKNLRRKFRAEGDDRPPLTMEVRADVSDCVDEIHPLYLEVLGRSSYRFEELTKAYFCELGRTMGDRARFFIWREEGRAVAVSLCMAHNGVLYDNYLGLDYAVALDRSLYFVTIRDLFDWACREKLRTYYSTPLNYDAKLHLRFALEPLDLYVRHLTNWINPFFTRIAPWLEPTRYDKLLPRFENHADLE